MPAYRGRLKWEASHDYPRHPDKKAPEPGARFANASARDRVPLAIGGGADCGIARGDRLLAVRGTWSDRSHPRAWGGQDLHEPADVGASRRGTAGGSEL